MSDAVTPEPVGGTPDQATEASHRPVLRVVKGDLTPEELAALVAVVAARNAAAAHAASGTKAPVRSEWGHPARQVRPPHVFGPDQWRRSSFGR